MANLQDIFNLAKADGGKFFVMDEKGEPKLVIMSVEEYQGMLLGKIAREVKEVEEINKEILKAQLQERSGGEFAGPTVSVQTEDKPTRPDMREEVIDPSFDFEGPKVEMEDL